MKKRWWVLIVLLLLVSEKVILGASMLISGVFGLVGWFIACALTVQAGT